MRKLLVKLFAIFLTYSSYAQNSDLPHNRYSLAGKDYTIKGFAVNLSATQSYFLNKTYGENVKNGDIKPAIGFEAMGKFFVKSFFLEGGYFWSRFNGVNFLKDNSFPEDSRIRHRGIEGAANIILFPSKSTLGFIKPYIGVGYQSAEIAVLTKEKSSGSSSDGSSQGKDSRISSLKTDAPYVQAGIMIYIKKIILLDAVYKRTTDSFQENKGNARLSVGISYFYWKK